MKKLAITIIVLGVIGIGACLTLKNGGPAGTGVEIQFLIEAVTLSLLGGVIGIVAGWLLGMAGASAIPGFPPAHVPIWAVALGVGFAAVVGVFFGTYPAAKAASLDPIEALRYE